ncbi:dimethylamine monooxygenase subunit DmmA family protein [Segnochrobactrum spirostomi]|uniref:Uncharacterized protein n=1 Tax=Segnochrobactrum spirostomi TaxID=2608987 RepID=A0A6A7Y004_9HYPH|nr:dimethylamine monooxygenase subunit DmmA family protein [Segnochrobactrum spirostomi]MQT11491.1 hypothetical protein [Segnochrobactrum spirostomi]
MLVAGIKSRPQYPGLVLDPKARLHLIAAEGEGALAVLALAAAGGPDFPAKTVVYYTPGGSAGAGHVGSLEALGLDALHVTPTVPTLLTRLDVHLATATMGTRLYTAGAEGFLGQVVQLGERHGIDHLSIRTEHCGSLARRVQCVHCKGITENVTTSIVPCAHCGLSLLVRDHYSRRLAAFMGVCVDAEAPGEVPAAEEIFR